MPDFGVALFLFLEGLQQRVPLFVLLDFVENIFLDVADQARADADAVGGVGFDMEVEADFFGNFIKGDAFALVGGFIIVLQPFAAAVRE